MKAGAICPQSIINPMLSRQSRAAHANRWADYRSQKGIMAKLYYCTCAKPDFVKVDEDYVCYKCNLPPISTVMPEPAAQQSVQLTGLTPRQVEEVEQIVMRVLLAYLAKSPRN